MLSFLSIYNDWGMWFLQFAVGVIFIYHGWPKMKKVRNFFSIGGGLHGLVEVIGGIALVLSWYVREVGLIFVIIMLAAIYMKKFKWNIAFSSHATTGWEFDLILFAASLYFVVR